MPNSKVKADHEANRKKVCAPCGQKISGKDVRCVNASQTEFLVQHMNDQFSTNNPAFPIGICNGCRLKISAVKQDAAKLKLLPIMPNYLDIILPRSTRSDDTPDCNCYVCLTGRDKTRSAKEKGGRGHVKNLSFEISQGNGLNGASSDNCLHPQDVKKDEKRSSIQICNVCRQQVGKGLYHACTIASSSTNIVQQVLQLPAIQQEQVVSGILSEKAKESTESGKKDIEISLATKGSKTKVLLNPSKAK